jgi:hypothetical protein
MYWLYTIECKALGGTAVIIVRTFFLLTIICKDEKGKLIDTSKSAKLSGELADG